MQTSIFSNFSKIKIDIRNIDNNWKKKKTENFEVCINVRMGLWVVLV